jgi:hypothetical protein
MMWNETVGGVGYLATFEETVVTPVLIHESFIRSNAIIDAGNATSTYEDPSTNST